MPEQISSDSEPLAVSVAKAAELVGVSKPTLYTRIMDGSLPSVKLGKRRLIPLKALRGWLAASSQHAA